jgi:MFS family permease
MSKGSLVRWVLGGQVEPGLGPLLTTLGLSVAGMYMFWSFFALWAIEELGMGKSDVGLAYLLAAGLGMTGGLTGGTLSDRLGRKPVIVAASIAQICLAATLVVPGLPVAAAVVVLVLFALTQPVRGAAQMALIADVVPKGRRTQAFGTFRVTFNAGALTGPLVAAGLVSVSWSALHAGVAIVFSLALLSALRLPAGRPVAADRDGQARARRGIVSPVFAALFLAGLLAAVTYNAFETLLPVSLTQEHGYAPAAWGVLFAINPVLVLVLQLRVTRWSQPLRPPVRLALAMLMMGCSFLLLLVSAAPAVLVTILAVFVLGEMLWAPNADALTARVAPARSRGAFMGALGISTWLGGALAPAVGLHLAEVGGDEAMWLAIATVATLGALAFVIAERMSHAHPRPGAMATTPAEVGVEA